MYTSPPGEAAIVVGHLNVLPIAGAPTIDCGHVAVYLPAYVVMVPSAETMRILQTSASTINSVPSRANAILNGLRSTAFVAFPPSPSLGELGPPPAIVVKMPSGVSRRMRLQLRSLMERFPSGPNATSF